MKIAFFRTMINDKNEVVADKTKKWYALTISSAYRTKAFGGKIVKENSLSGRILSSTKNENEAANFSDNEVELVQAFYAVKKNRLNHQIVLDNP